MDVHLPDWMAGEFSVSRVERTTAVVRNDFAESFQAHRLLDCPRAPLLSLPTQDDASSGTRDGIAGGRGTVRVVSAGPLGEAVVRPYRRGGLVEKVNRRRYFLGNRAFSELVATHRLRKRGAPVPEALAAVQWKAHPGYQACIVTRRIPKTRAAAVVLADPAAARVRCLEAMGRAIRRFHEAGGIHPDLNAHNLLIQEEGDGPVFVIDLDRVSVLSNPAPERRARTNLARLRRSLVKLGLEGALSDWDCLERAYSALPEPPPAA